MKLFRENAVESYREQFSVNKQVKKMPISITIFSCIFIVGLILAIIWIVFGSIVETVNITGVVFPSKGIETITADNSGIITDVVTQVGEEVKVGDVIAIMPNAELLHQMENNQTNTEIYGKKDMDTLRKEYSEKSIIVSKCEGKVVSVAEEGNFLMIGEEIATIAATNSHANQRQIFAFLPTSQRNNIERGSAVQVSPNYAPREKYGYINGYVVDIGDEIITKQNAENRYNYYNIPNLLKEDETYIAVYINLLADESTSSQLNWSNNSSGHIDLETGTMCESLVVVSKNAPYKKLHC